MLSSRCRAATVTTILCIGACRSPGYRGLRLDDAALERIANAALPAVIRIRGAGAMAQSSGAGFLVNGHDGRPLIITNAHVIWGADDVAVDMSDGRSVRAVVVGADLATDIAVLRADIAIKNGRALSFSNGQESRPGMWVVSIGSPGGLLNAISVGVISASGRVPRPTLAAQEFIPHLFIDAAVFPGDSGGPVLDLEGSIIGVESATLAGTGLGIVIPGPVVEEIVKAIERHGTFRHGSIGVQIDRGSRSAATEGVLVTECLPDCALGTLKVGDRILAIDGDHVSGIGAFDQRVFMNSPGTRWLLEVERNGRNMFVTVVLQEMTQDRFVQEQLPASRPSRVGSPGGG